ncbi:MAG: hypothetical protein ABIX28_25535 [Vicinamibacterales bacterium]
MPPLPHRQSTLRGPSLRALLCAAVILAGDAAPAHADWQFAPFFGYAFKGETTLFTPETLGDLKVRWTVGGTVTLIGRGPLGVEGTVLLVPRFFEAGNLGAVTSSRTYAVMGNVVLAAPQGWNEYGLRPYVSGGLGLIHATQRTTASVFSLNQNLLGYNVGGGATGFISEHTGLRFDLRYYSSLSRTDDTVAIGPVRLRYWTGTVGVVLKY